MRALVADDEPMICDLLTRFLSRRGYVVIAAEDGEKALDQLRAHRADILMLDILLPKVDGLGVLEQIRQEDIEVGTVWVMTGRADEDSVKRSLDLGADDVFTKPLNLSHLDWLVQLEQGRVAADRRD
jgi:two-component system response regulator MtrA